MPGSRRRIGAHLPLGSGMVKAADRAAEIGADALQIFSDNPTAWRRRSGPPAELHAFLRRLELLDLGPLAIHASYLVNLAGPDDQFHEKSVDVLAHELVAGQAYGARFVNVHIGSHRGTGIDVGAERVATTVLRAFEKAGQGTPGPVLSLENSAGGGFGMGSTIDELALVMAAIDGRGLPRDRIGITLDTAHLWGAGHPIDTGAGLDQVVQQFDDLIGLDRLAMIHLNDSRAERGSALDRHQHIGAGQIGEEGMRGVLSHPRLAHVPVYLETPGMDEGFDAVNLARCRALLAGQPLDELPPEALVMRGSRSRSAPQREAGDDEVEDESAPKQTPTRAQGRRSSRTGQ